MAFVFFMNDELLRSTYISAVHTTLWPSGVSGGRSIRVFQHDHCGSISLPMRPRCFVREFEGKALEQFSGR